MKVITNFFKQGLCVHPNISLGTLPHQHLSAEDIFQPPPHLPPCATAFSSVSFLVFLHSLHPGIPSSNAGGNVASGVVSYLEFLQTYQDPCKNAAAPLVVVGTSQHFPCQDQGHYLTYWVSRDQFVLLPSLTRT